MKVNRKVVIGSGLLCFVFSITGFAEEYSLQYFLEKTSASSYKLSKEERLELLSGIGKVLGQAQEVRSRLSEAVQKGAGDIKYQEGKFWMSQLDQDQGSIDSGFQQLKALKGKARNLVSAIKLYKSLKDLSFHFNSYNSLPAFSAYIGDIAPELELWADPVFYRLYLLPTAQAKSASPKPLLKKRRSGRQIDSVPSDKGEK